MKNLKKLSAAFMLAALLSSSLTSCIDNEVSPVVEAIYANQAELLAAQAAVQNANAEYRDAQTAYQNAMTAYQEEVTANAANVNAQNLLALIATTNLAVATAENSLAIAKANFDIDMAELLAELEAAGADLALGYAEDYADAMNDANDYLSAKLDAQEELAVAQLMLNGDVSWEFALAQLQGDITSQTANKTALEAAIADLEVYMADPTVSEAMVSDLAAQNVALQATIDAKIIEGQVIFNEIMAIYVENGVRGDFIDRFEEAKGDLDDAKADKKDKEDEISDLEDEIADLLVVLADYPAALAAGELAVTNADAAQVVAEDNVEAAELALVTLNDTLDDKQTELIDANAAWTVLDAAVTALNGTYQTAIADYASAQATYNTSAVGLVNAFDAAELALTTGEGLVATNQLNYNAKKAAFELNPTGFVWSAGVDAVLGIHPTAVGPHDSYTVVTAITPVVIGAVTVSAGSGADLTTLGTYASFLAGIMNGGGAEVVAVNDFYNVGADDVANGTNEFRLDAALVALTSSLDAIPTLETAVEDAQDAIDNAEENLAEAKLLFENKRDLYEGQVALLEAAVAAQEAAVTAEEDAQDAVTDADAALVVLEDIADEAVITAGDAADDLDALENYDADSIQEDIDTKTGLIADCNDIIAKIQPIIDAKQAIVDAMQVEYDANLANQGHLSSLDADLHAAIITKWQALWVLMTEVQTIELQQELNDALASAYGTDDLEDLADDLADLQGDLVEAIEAIEKAEVALAEAKVEEAADTAYLTYLQAIVDEAQANYDAATAIAAEYKALMDAALGN